MRNMNRRERDLAVLVAVISALAIILAFFVRWVFSDPCPEETHTEISTESPSTKDTSLFWSRPVCIEPPQLVVVEASMETVGAPELTTEELTTEPETAPEISMEPETTPAPTETEAAAAPSVEIVETQKEIVETPAPEAEIPLYSCHGLVLDPELQRFAYTLLEGYGMRGYYEYFLCQAYQESTYQADQRTLNHDCWDCGLMQIREIYWPEWSAESGIVGDIMDPYDNVRMACYILSRYWSSTGSIAETISLYMAGWGGPWQEQYVSDVTSHLPFLARIN